MKHANASTLTGSPYPEGHLPLRGDWARLNSRWSCRFSLVDGQIVCHWNRKKPPRLEQLLSMFEAYEKVKLGFLASIRQHFGIDVVAIDAATSDGELL